MSEKRVNADQLVDLLVGLGVETAKDWSLQKLEEKINQGSGLAKYWDDTAPLKDPDAKRFYDEVVAAQVQGDRVVPEEKPFSLAGAGGIVEAAKEIAAELKDAPREVVVAEFGAVLGVPDPVVSAGDPIKNGDGEIVGTALHAAPKGEIVSVKVATPKTAARKTVPPKPVRRPAKEKARVGRTRTPGRPPADSTYAEKREFWAANPIRMTQQGPGVMRTVYEELVAAGKGVTFEKGVVGGRKPKPMTKKDLHEALKIAFPDRDPAKMWVNLNNIIPCRLREHYSIHVWRQRTTDGETGYYIVGDGKTPQPGTTYGSRDSKPAKTPKSPAKPRAAKPEGKKGTPRPKTPTGRPRGRPRKTAAAK